MREIGYVKFGVLEYGDIVKNFTRRHHFTTDLVGSSYAWAYSDTMSSIHVYSLLIAIAGRYSNLTIAVGQHGVVPVSTLSFAKMSICSSG